MFHSELWFVYSILYILGFFPKFLFWLYLWQKKEYRADKMQDYWTMPESKAIIFDKWTKIRLTLVIFFILSYFLINYNYSFFVVITDFLWSGNAQILPFGNWNWVFTLLASFLLFAESLELFIKIVLHRKILLPKITAKLLLLGVLSLITFLVLPIFFQSYLSLIVITMLAPVIVGYWIVVIYPIDWYVKNQIFRKARKYRESLQNLKVIAISGSFGKTTTKEILSQLLGTRFAVEKTIKNQNSNMSCARKMLSLSDQTDYFICELGSYKRGDGSEICQFVRPNGAIITGLNYQHLSLFGSEENIVLTESEAVNFLPENGLAIVNWCMPLNRKIQFPNQVKPIKCAVEGFGIKPGECDFYGFNLQQREALTEFDLDCQGRVYHLKTNLLSSGNIQNLILALAQVSLNGISIESLQEDLLKIDMPEGTLQVENKTWGKLINDSYNTNFDGVVNAVNLICSFAGQTIVLVDDILELGPKSVPTHRELAEILAKQKIDLLVLLGRSFSSLIQEDIQKINPEMQVVIWNEYNTSEIQNQITKMMENSPTNILLEGYQSRKFVPDISQPSSKRA